MAPFTAARRASCYSFWLYSVVGGTVIVGRKPFPPQLPLFADPFKRVRVGLHVHDPATLFVPLGVVPASSLELRAILHGCHLGPPPLCVDDRIGLANLAYESKNIPKIIAPIRQLVAAVLAPVEPANAAIP